MPDSLSSFGVVAIGRNEGDRLRRCLDSIVSATKKVVYVDSGSTDDSREMAKGLGVDVVELDLTIPFTAARARNEGFDRLHKLNPDLKYVQFVDGDCEIVGAWLEKARQFLDEHEDVAVVCGRRRERYPDRSVYNLLCDMEWDTPIGEAKACGGDAMMRVETYVSVNGFRADLIAGEEPELCVRMRASGWKVWRLDEEMTLHDAAMIRFGQWWKRSMRSGYAYAEGAHLHGAPPERHWVLESRRIWMWGLGIPVFALLAASVLPIVSALVLILYPAQVVRLAMRNGHGSKIGWWRAFFLVLGKFPEVIGQMKFLHHRFVGGTGRLIEYK